MQAVFSSGSAAIALSVILSAWPGWGPSCFAQRASGPARTITQARPQRRALLIGINEYQNVWNLRGSVNDVTMMKRVLITEFGFPSNQIDVLTDAHATREGILTALRRLVDTAGPDDVVYIHYSGHGSQVKDMDGDEAAQDGDGMDETLVPHDGRSPGVPDITDDELDEILSGMVTRNVVIVLDSCHSGTATRSLSLQTRSVPPDKRLDLYRQTTLRSRGFVPVEERNVLMTGARSNEEALDGPIEGTVRGFFSHALAVSLNAAGPHASLREIERGVQRELERLKEFYGRTSMPEPQFELPNERRDQPLFPSLETRSPESPSFEIDDGEAGAAGVARHAWAKVQPLPEDRVVLEGGADLEGVPGSRWALYPQGEREFLPGEALATVRVESAQGPDATARVDQKSRPVEEGWRAVRISPSLGRDPVPVCIVESSPDRRAWLTELLKRRCDNVDIVERGEFARFMLEIKDDTCRVLDAAGIGVVDTVSIGDEQSLTSRLGMIFTRSQDASALLSLDNPGSLLDLDVKVAISAEASVSRMGTRGIRVTPNLDAPQYHVRRAGEPRSLQNSLILDVSVSQDCYVTVVDVDCEGGVNILFPNDYQNPGFYPGGKVSKKQRIRIPDSLERGNVAGFNWDYQPPVGMDTIRVFACTSPDKAEEIRRLVAEMASQGPAGRGLDRGERRLACLERLQHSLSARGIVVVSNQPVAEQQGGVQPAAAGGSWQAASSSDWAAASITIVISE